MNKMFSAPASSAGPTGSDPLASIREWEHMWQNGFEQAMAISIGQIELLSTFTRTALEISWVMYEPTLSAGFARGILDLGRPNFDAAVAQCRRMNDEWLHACLPTRTAAAELATKLPVAAE